MVAQNYDAPQPIEVEALWNGWLYVGSTTEIAVGTGENFHAELENPVGSGVTVRIVRLVATLTAGPIFTSLHENQTTGNPTTDRTILDANREQDTTPEATLTADSVGTEYDNPTGTEFGLESGTTVKNGINLLIPPGGVMGLEAAGDLIGASGSVNVWFIEEKRPP